MDSPTQVPDNELLRQSVTRPDLLGVLYERHAAAVFRHLARRVGATPAEDLLGEVFVIALEARLRFRPHESGSALPWLYGIAANVVRAHRRRAAPTCRGTDAEIVDWDAVDARLDASARRGALRAALAVLKDEDRELLLLVAWEGHVGRGRRVARYHRYRGPQPASPRPGQGPGRPRHAHHPDLQRQLKENLMDLDTLFHETAHVSDPDETALARGRLALDAATHASARRVATLVRSGRRRPGRHLAVVLATTAAAAAVIVAVPAVSVHGPPLSGAQAAQVLLAAGRAGGQQSGGWPKAPYWHVVEQEQRDGGPVVRREIWLGHTQPGVLHDPIAGPGGGGYTRLTPALFLEGITWDQLYQLPTEPVALEQVLRADGVGHGPDADSELWDEATRALVESPASPSLRRALWEVAARVPGVRPLGARTDALGRNGIALQRDDETFLIDTKTGTLLQHSGGSGFRYTYVSQGPAGAEPVVTGSVN